MVSSIGGGDGGGFSKGDGCEVLVSCTKEGSLLVELCVSWGVERAIKVESNGFFGLLKVCEEEPLLSDRKEESAFVDLFQFEVLEECVEERDALDTIFCDEECEQVGLRVAFVVGIGRNICFVAGGCEIDAVAFE